MTEFAEHNRRAWDEVHRRRHASHGQALGLDASQGNWRGTDARIPGSFTLLASKGG